MVFGPPMAQVEKLWQLQKQPTYEAEKLLAEAGLAIQSGDVTYAATPTTWREARYSMEV